MRSSQPVPHRSAAFKAHALTWVVAGLASALYIGWTRWEAGGAGTSVAMKGDSAGPGIEAALDRLAGDVRSIHGKLATSEESTHALLGRVAALEEKAVFVTAAATAPASPAPAKADREPPATRVGDARPPVAAVAPRPSEITTGAILQRAVPPAAPAPTAAASTNLTLAADGGTQPVVTTISLSAPNDGAAPPSAPPKPALGIQLSSAANLDALRLNWSLLSERHREVLGQLQTRYRQASGKPNAPYQLIAGPIRSQGEAARICKALAGSGVSCRATTYTGETL